MSKSLYILFGLDDLSVSRSSTGSEGMHEDWSDAPRAVRYSRPTIEPIEEPSGSGSSAGPLLSSNPDSNYTDMSEQRFAQLEARMVGIEGRMDRMDAKMDSVVQTLADIRVDLATKPSTAALWTMVATVLGVALAIAGLTFVVADYATRLPT